MRLIFDKKEDNNFIKLSNFINFISFINLINSNAKDVKTLNEVKTNFYWKNALHEGENG